MTAAKAPTILDVSDFFAWEGEPRAKIFSPEIFYGLASGEMQAVSKDGEPMSMLAVAKKCLQSTDLTIVFQAQMVIVTESVKELDRMRPLAAAGTLTEDDAKKLGSILSLAATNPFKNGSHAGMLASRTAHSVLTNPDNFKHENLRVSAYLGLCDWDGNYRIDMEGWRRYAKGIEHRIAPALLNNLIKKDPREFARAVLQMTRPEGVEHYPEGTRAKVFETLRMMHTDIPVRLGQRSFETIRERLEPSFNEEERGIFKLIEDGYGKRPSLDNDV